MAIKVHPSAAPEVFEIVREIETARVDVDSLLKRAEIDATTWGRWVGGKFAPRMSTFRRFREALAAELARDAA